MIGEDALTVLRRGWRQQMPFGLFRPLHASITFVEDRLELGAGAVLARMVRGDLGETVLAFEGGEERTLALLTVAYLRPVQARALAHLRRGARDWARGEKCLAHLHLAFGGLSKLDEPEEAAFRIFVADNLLKARVPARYLLKAFGLDPGSTGALEKYSPDQPRVPQGSGRPSGQWTSDGGGGDASPRFTPAQFMPPILAEPPFLPPLFAEPPVTPLPPLAEWPTDPTVSPGPGWEWKGRPGSQPGDRYGNWHDEENNQSLHPDLNHPPGIAPHWDWYAPDGSVYRWFQDGTLQPTYW